MFLRSVLELFIPKCSNFIWCPNRFVIIVLPPIFTKSLHLSNINIGDENRKVYAKVDKVGTTGSTR